MTLWMMWATAVTGLLALAGLALERALRLLGRPGRFAWMAALCGSAAILAWSVVRPAPLVESPSSTPVAAAFGQELVGAAALALPDWLPALDTALAIGWASSSLLLLVVLVGGLARLGRIARSWPRVSLESGDVLLSEDFGPALVGVWSPRVVVPRWALRLGPERLRMAVLHEAEHRRTGDGIVLVIGALAAAAAPWNLALWWTLSRLRAAVELDCDARVLRLGVPPRVYGALLLELGARATHAPAGVAAFARPRSTLERRMKMIVNHVRPRGATAYTHAGAALLAALSLVVVACDAPMPTAAPEATGTGELMARLRPVDASMPERDGSGLLLPKTVGEALAGPGGLLLDRVPLEAAEERAALERRAAEEMRTRLESEASGGTIRLRATADGEALPDKQPLVYVDGVRMDGDRVVLDELDPDEIERVEVLKGGAARALYGEEASGGVIQIFKKPAGAR